MTSTRATLMCNSLVRPFEVGQSVDYRNHVVGYDIFPLDVVEVTETTITAESAEGRKYIFDLGGVATWSGNLSISHRLNNPVSPGVSEVRGVAL